jgi:hypothetical protein
MNDPSALFRAMLGEWEKMANSLGGDMLKSDDWSRTMHGAQGATLNAQAAFKQMSERVLAAANMPSRTEFEQLSVRIGGIETSLHRIEALLKGGGPPALPDRPKPARTRKPPEPQG